MKKTIIVLLVIFNVAFCAIDSTSPCIDTSFSFLLNHFTEMSKINNDCFGKIFNKKIIEIKSNPTLSNVIEYLQIASKIKDNEELSKWFAEGYEYVLLNHTKIMLDAMLQLGFNERGPIYHYYFNKPIFIDRKTLDDTLKKYKDNRKYDKIFNNNFDKYGIYDVEKVSMIQLIANPEKYHGKKVSVVGIIRLVLEGTAIYLDQNSFEIGIDRNVIWLSLDSIGVNLDSLIKKSPSIDTSHFQQCKINGNWVCITGIFNKYNTGHMGCCSGGLEKISRIDFLNCTNSKSIK